MTELKENYTAGELACLVGISQQAVDKRARREGWTRHSRTERGGGYYYRVCELPESIRQQIAMALMHNAPAVVEQRPQAKCPAVPSTPATQLTAKQRAVMEARLAFVREIERQTLLVGKERAIRNLLAAVQGGTLPAHMQGLVLVANACPGDGSRRALSRRRLYAWCQQFAVGGEVALAPQYRQPDMSVPAWVPVFLRHYQRPQKPALANAYREFCSEYAPPQPSIDAVRAWLKKMARSELEAGRRTGNALLKLRPYKRRSTDELWPGDVYTADGTTFDAEIQHPQHGNPFKPEITLVVDVATRRCVGVSTGVSESGWTILDALRVACLVGGIPAMLYSDNGSGYHNALLEAPGLGMLARLGIEMTNSIAGRPQGKGLMERAVQTVLTPYSKRLPSCSHADMDQDVAKKVYKLTRADIKARGGSPLLPLWQDFLDGLLVRVNEYNAAPHRALPKIEVAGRRRHMTPDELWQDYLDRGFAPVQVPEDLRDELFMPGVERKVANGMVQLFNGRYYSDELTDFHGDLVEVRYDVWDSSYVTIWTSRGEKICTAQLDGNVIPYFPPSRIEAARARREKAQITRLENKANRIVPGARIELPEVPQTIDVIADTISPREVVLAGEVADAPAEPLQAIPETPQPDKPRRPILFSDANARYRWLARNKDAWTPEDEEWLQNYVDSPQYTVRAEIYRNEGIPFARVAPDLYAARLKEGEV